MKEGIDIHNYEAWLLDRLEGRLSPEEEKQLESFLHAHPECGSQLDGEELWSLELKPVTYHGKENLFKKLPDAHTKLGAHNFDLFSIARMEGDLNPSQEEAHEAMVAEQDQWGKEWQTWQRTKLQAEAISYADKQGLYRRRPLMRRMVWWPMGAAAAVAALVFILFRSSPDVDIPVNLAQERTPVMQEHMPDIQEQPGIAASPVEAAVEAEKIYAKQQDSPERIAARDSTSRMVREEELQPRGLRLATLENYPGHEADPGQADVIHSLDLPVFAARSQPKRLREVSRDFLREKDVSILTLAHAGIQGINRLTGSDLSLDLARTEDGDVSGFSYQGSLMTVEAPVGKTD